MVSESGTANKRTKLEFILICKWPLIQFYIHHFKTDFTSNRLLSIPTIYDFFFSELCVCWGERIAFCHDCT